MRQMIHEDLEQVPPHLAGNIEADPALHPGLGNFKSEIHEDIPQEDLGDSSKIATQDDRLIKVSTVADEAIEGLQRLSIGKAFF